MKIAIPLYNGRLSAHFGHCQQFAVVDADPETRTIGQVDLHNPPAHEPGVLPRWLAKLGVDLVIAGGMGQRAQQLFSANGIDVLTGAPDNTPEQLVESYLAGQLACGPNACDH
ncbi:MAG: NifB/NifX family molybdenum-iron cluster-binding protein [Sedimentisphaerales bacterium]|nr:NifB/NifX family molybdenum-iron cluster-binding protein [Sedimentisphaerales bacterium]